MKTLIGVPNETIREGFVGFRQAEGVHLSSKIKRSGTLLGSWVCWPDDVRLKDG